MIARIVEMTFRPGKTAPFLRLFGKINAKIRRFPGCRSLWLLRERRHPDVIVTWSIWNSEKDLLSYRDSELFKANWNKVKSWHTKKTKALTLDIMNYPAAERTGYRNPPPHHPDSPQSGGELDPERLKKK